MKNMIKLTCPNCKKEFSAPEYHFIDCPYCDYNFSHTVISETERKNYGEEYKSFTDKWYKEQMAKKEQK